MQLFPGLEERGALLADLNAVAGARIATDACITKFERKRAKAAQFDTVTAGERGSDLVEDCTDDYLGVALKEMWVGLSQPLNEFRFRHREQRSRG
jgi:hypothetical protein